MSKTLNFYRATPPSSDELQEMILNIDNALDVFKRLGIPGHVTAHYLHGFRVELTKYQEAAFAADDQGSPSP